MRSIFLMLFFSASIYTNAQTIEKNTSAVAEKASVREVSLDEKTEKNPPASSFDAGADAARNSSSVYVRPDAKTRFQRYVKSVVGPTALAKNAATAGILTATDSPEEWGPHWDGFGRRFASNFGSSAIKNTTAYALDEAFELDSRFYRSQKKDIRSRVTNALISPVTARTKEGKRVFGFPRIAGTYAGSVISREVWYPKRFDYKDGLRSGTISLGTNALFNLFREFVLKK